MRVLAIGPGGACRGEGDAHLAAQGAHTLGGALGAVETHEIAAARMRPGGATGAVQALMQLGIDALEARAHELGMTTHMGAHGVQVGQEAHVTQLVELVGADKTGLQMVRDLLDDHGRGGNKTHASTGEGDLGGGGEGDHAILVASLARGVEDVKELVALVIQVMHAVGVVPEDAEIGGGRLHRGEATDRLVGVGVARGVGVLGDAPDALDTLIGRDEALDLVHVRTVLDHTHGNVLDAQILGDAEVAIVAGRGTEELDTRAVVRGGELGPRSMAARALEPAHGHGIMLDQQTGATEHERLGRIDAQKLPGERAGGGDALEATVVAAVHAAVGKVGVSAEQVEHGARDGHLLGRRLAASHIELELARLDLGDTRLEIVDGGGQLGVVHRLIHRLHDGSLSHRETRGASPRRPRYAASLRIETVYVVYQAPLHSRTECVESHARLRWGQGLKWGQVRIGRLRCRADGRPGQSLGLHPSQLERPRRFTIPQQGCHRSTMVNGRFLKVYVRRDGVHGGQFPHLLLLTSHFIARAKSRKTFLCG